MINPSTIARKARLLATAAPFALVLAASPAMAQETAPAQERDTQIKDIVVTGSILRRTDTETPSPVTVLTSQDLEARGINTVSEAVTRLSANNAGTIPQSWNVGYNFATGATAVSLRGLTTSSTLTIFDGLRSAPYPLADDGRRNFVDLNTIPEGIVDRIEVVKDGASSTYGADAVAGVVNVITKKQVTGVHLNASSGISQEGDGGEQRISGTVGFGRLDEDGFNAYLSAEYQVNDPLFARDRGYPYNTADWSKICGASGSCLPNAILNGISADGSFGFGTTTVPVVRPYENGSAAGVYQLLNPGAGCGNLTPVTLTPAQQLNGDGDPTYAADQCQQDLVNDYAQNAPRIERKGLSGRVTFNVGNAEFYAMGNWYQVSTDSSTTPLTFAGRTAAGGTQVTLSPLLLPVYVCPRGTTVACTSTNGTLNPNNPFAAMGQEAQLNYRYDRGRSSHAQADTFRGAIGVKGSFGDDWNYAADFTMSHIRLGIDYSNYIYAQHLLDVIADGSYNFVDPSQNSEEIRNYLTPKKTNVSTSDLYQGQATLSKSLFDLPGGPLQVAVGGAWRNEKIDNPSANPANNENPTERYYSINSVGVNGSRDVWSAFFEANAPVVDQFELNLSGRYDSYSSGQKNFSPKIGAKFVPIKQVALRGTYSRGFRIPSFNESYGLPTTGYVSSTIDPTTTDGAAFIAAHGGNAYATQSYSYGLTSTGNPNLKPEKSRSFTGGIVIEPTRQFTFTVDYWNIHVKDLISGADYSDVLDEYYANNGTVNIPGITVLPGIPDPDHPNALPVIGFIQYSYQNADSEDASGIDFSATARIPFGNVRWTSSLDASYLIKYAKNFADGEQRYDGTLSPCDVTSCSGSPKWRGNWQNTFVFGESTTVSATAYYTSGYDNASIDYGGIKGDCEASIGGSVVPYDDGTPSLCKAKSFFYVDMSFSQKVGDKFTLYANVLNVLGAKAPFDPSAAYGLYGYNPAWASSGFMGRYFRVGAKVDF